MIRSGWLYCFRTFGFTQDRSPIYKVGRTIRKNPNDRLDEYSGPSRCAKLLLCNYVDDISIETHILQSLRREKSVEYLEDLGREYFTCVNDIKMKDIVRLIISEWSVEHASNMYVTKENDRVTVIAKKFNITPEQLIEANNHFSKRLRKKDRFYAGTELNIPL